MPRYSASLSLVVMWQQVIDRVEVLNVSLRYCSKSPTSVFTSSNENI
jgi:hypothetical protein